MGFRFKKQVGPKGITLNAGKKGINSVSLKTATGITYNSKRRFTLSIPRTGIIYNFGKKKVQKLSNQPTMIDTSI